MSHLSESPLLPFGVPRALVYGLGLYLVAYVYARVTR